MPRRVMFSPKDFRLLRRGAAITLYLWTFVLLAFTSGTVLPFAAAGTLESSRMVESVGIGILASLVFAALFGGASLFLPERELPQWGHVILGLVALVLGPLALVSSIAIAWAVWAFEIGTNWAIGG